eukprot:scaffold1318_cov388-Prasinococcus_capsulatus_cf.AAC.66
MLRSFSGFRLGTESVVHVRRWAKQAQRATVEAQTADGQEACLPQDETTNLTEAVEMDAMDQVFGVKMGEILDSAAVVTNAEEQYV